jgi:hypothetical protein
LGDLTGAKPEITWPLHMRRKSPNGGAFESMAGRFVCCTSPASFIQSFWDIFVERTG